MTPTRHGPPRCIPCICTALLLNALVPPARSQYSAKQLPELLAAFRTLEESRLTLLRGGERERHPVCCSGCVTSRRTSAAKVVCRLQSADHACGAGRCGEPGLVEEAACSLFLTLSAGGPQFGEQRR